MPNAKKRFIVRQLKWEDFPDMASNFFGYFEEAKKDPYFGLTTFAKRPTMQDEVGWFADFYKSVLDGKRVAFVAVADGKVVGSCEARSMLRGQTHVGELGIAIKKEYRSMGIGQALIKEVLKRSRGKFEILTLKVFGHNARAKHVYQKMGFMQYGTLKKGIKRGKLYFDEDEMYINLKRFKD